MKHLFLIFSFSLLFLFGVNSIQTVYAQDKVNPVPQTLNYLQLDKNLATLNCPPGIRPLSNSGLCGQNTIKVTALIPKKKMKKMALQYKVSGGKIIGNGEFVEWDLSGAKPGTYTITLISNEKNIPKELQTEKITLTECDECGCGFCNCSIISEIMMIEDVPQIGTKSPVEAGDEITLTASVIGGDQTNIYYKWEIKGGKIIGGQGTPQIRVKTDLEAKEVIASIVFEGMCADCPNTTSTTIKLNDK